MDRELSVLLVEDDQKACANIIKLVDDTGALSLIGVTNNSEKALEYVSDYLPDAVILDLELHQGYGNGILFLQELRQLALPKIPYILVSTNNSSAITYDYVRQLGADFIMSKHQPDYSEKSVVDFLIMMKEIIIAHAKRNAVENNTNETPAQKNKRITRRIFTELDLIGISQKSVGHTYLVEAILIILNKPTINICDIIGKKYGKTTPSVERAMQNAISRAWRITDIDDLLLHYTAKISSERGVPTITEFVYYYANKIKNEY